MEQPMQPMVRRSSRRMLPMRASSAASVAVAAPRNGPHCTKEEAVRILSAATIKERTPVIDDWIVSGKIPCQRQHMYKLLKKFSDNPNYDLSKPWGVAGREPLLTEEDTAEVAATLDQKSGSTMARDEIGNFIRKKRGDKITAAGFAPIDGLKEASHTTASNCAGLIASQPTVSIAKTAIKKTQTRCTAENSLISSMALAVVVAATHFTPTPDDTTGLKKELQGASEGAKKFCNMAQDACRGSDAPLSVKPQPVLSSDDTVTLAGTGAEKKKKPCGGWLEQSR